MKFTWMLDIRTWESTVATNPNVIKDNCSYKEIDGTAIITINVHLIFNSFGEIDNVFLPLFRDELKETDMLYADINNKIHRLREEILENENRLEELIKQEADTKADLNSWRDKVSFKY